MDKLDFKEKFWGGIFGIVSIAAAIAEMFVGGICTESVVGAIKDVSGTLIVVVLLITFLKNLPHIPKDFDGTLNAKLNAWIEEHKNMIFIKDDIKCRDIYMKTDVANFFNPGTSAFNGRFAIIKANENDAFQIIFSLNKSLFIGHDGEKGNIPAILESFGRKFETYAKTL